MGRRGARSAIRGSSPKVAGDTAAVFAAPAALAAPTALPATRWIATTDPMAASRRGAYEGRHASDEGAAEGQDRHGREHADGRLPDSSREPARIGAAGRAEKGDPVDLHEAGQGQGADCREDGRRHDRRRDRLARQPDRPEEAEVYEKLAHEAVQGGKAANGHRADEKEGGGPGHGFRESAHEIDTPRPRAADRRSGAQEKERLEEAVIPDVEEAARQAEDQPIAPMGRAAEHREAEAHHDDADVFDAVVGQEPLKVVLGYREDDSEKAADHAQAEHRAAPGRRRLGQQEDEAHEGIDAHLQHYAGEHRGNVAGRARVRSRKPEMQGHDSGLEPEADQGEEEEGAQRAYPRGPGGDRPQGEGAGRPFPEREHGEYGQAADMCRYQVDEAGSPALRFPILGRDEEEGRQGHGLPAEYEGQSMLGDEEEDHAGDEDAPEELEPASARGAMRLRPVSQAVDRAQAAHEENGDQEEGAKAVDPDKAAIGPQRRRAGDRPRKTRDRGVIDTESKSEPEEGSGKARESGRAHEDRGDALSPDRASGHEEAGQAAYGRKGHRDKDQAERHGLLHGRDGVFGARKGLHQLVSGSFPLERVLEGLVPEHEAQPGEQVQMRPHRGGRRG